MALLDPTRLRQKATAEALAKNKSVFCEACALPIQVTRQQLYSLLEELLRCRIGMAYEHGARGVFVHKPSSLPCEVIGRERLLSARGWVRAPAGATNGAWLRLVEESYKLFDPNKTKKPLFEYELLYDFDADPSAKYQHAMWVPPSVHTLMKVYRGQPYEAFYKEALAILRQESEGAIKAAVVTYFLTRDD